MARILNQLTVFARTHHFLGIGLFLIVVLGLVCGFITGFRVPSLYVCTQLIFTYEYGFIPRGLIGSAIKFFAGNSLYHSDTVYPIIIAVGVSFLLWVAYNAYLSSIKNNNAVMTILLIWFSISSYPSHYAHLMGYFEQYAYILAIIFIEVALRVKNLGLIVALGGVFSFISVLISETNAFMVCPVLISISLMVIYQQAGGISKIRFSRLLWLLLVHVPSAVYCMVIRIKTGTLVSVDQLASLVREAEQYTDYMDPRIKGLVNLFINRGSNWEVKIHLIPAPMLMFTVLVLALVFIYLRQNSQKTTAIVYFLLTLFIAGSCYSLVFHAWDLPRYFSSMSIGALLLAIYILRCYNFKLPREHILYISTFGTIAVIAINAFQIPLFDGAKYNFFIRDFVLQMLRQAGL